MMASTGPRPRGPGVLGPRPRLTPRDRASTGPRPRGRGVTARLRPRALQRGRARAGAEWSGCLLASTGPRPRGLSASNARGFNGAAPARARSDSYCDYRVAQIRASTGPRPRGRGVVWKYQRLPASTGPRPRGRGVAHVARPRVASTGPRPRGRGVAEPAMRMRSFNGAAPPRAR